MKAVSFIVTFIAALSPMAASAQAFPAYGSMIGTWNCTSAFGSSIAYRFSMTDDGGWLALRSIWNNPNGSGSSGFFQNYFRREPDGTGVATSYGSNGWTFQGRSPSWTGSSLTFTGVQQTGRGDYRARETFTWIAGKLQHRWEERYNGAWRTTSDTTCARG
jgi:hypothetical protein